MNWHRQRGEYPHLAMAKASLGWGDDKGLELDLNLHIAVKMKREYLYDYTTKIFPHFEKNLPMYKAF